MIRFSLLGIPIQIHPWFWITLVIIGGGSTANSKDGILRLALFILAGLISILVHELGHALTGRAFGARSEITLQAFGGLAAFVGARFTRPQQFLVTAAGPVAQILLGLIPYLLIPGLFKLTSNAGYFWMILTWISFAWALINLLPVLPLDGGQMLNSLLGPARIRTTLWVTIITSISAALIVFMDSGSIIFPLFLALFGWQAWQALKQNAWR
ncbi:MAG: site-2 protease family protein [Verrucomicrobia bacterium]|nr:site-2 protease family protein [Verrucomicrobiota bacterium]